MEDFREIITQNRVYIVEKVNVMETSLLDRLVQEGVMNQEQLKSIKEENKNNIQRVSAILDHLDSRTSEDWSTFLKCLSNSGFDFVVKELSSPDADFGDLQRLVARKIRDQYRVVELWSLQEPSKSVPLEEIFVDVVLKCTSCNVLASYKEVFKKFSEAATVHVYGEPGTGKSMLSTRLCFDWASQHARGGKTKPALGGNVGDLKFVLPVYLKDVKQGHAFLEFVAESYGLEMEDAGDLCSCIEKYQESILLVFDGLDEYDGISDEITKILQRNMYPRIKMLITSRNTAVEDTVNGKCAPDLELTLHGFSDNGVQEYVQKIYRGFPYMVEGMLLEIKKSNCLDCLSHYPALLLLIINLWQAALNKHQTNLENSFFLEFVAYAIGQNENKQKRLYPIRKSTDLLIKENHEIIITLGKLASTSIKKDRMDQEFSSTVVSDNINPDELIISLKFGFLLKRQGQNGQYVYTFVHKAIQDMFLSYFLGNRSYTELVDLALTFCECQKAFIGCDISWLTSFIEDYDTRRLIKTLCGGNEESLAEIHTGLQLESLRHNKEVDLVLPKVTYLTIGSGNCENVAKYFSKDGSRLEKLNVRSHEKFLCLLDNLTAPNLTCFSKSKSCEEIYNVEQVYIDRIVSALLRFPLKVLTVRDIYQLSEQAKCAIVQAACNIKTLEQLSFSFGTLTAEHIHALSAALPESNLRTLIIRECDLEIDPLLEIIDVLPNCIRLEKLDVSRNYIKSGVERLLNKTDKFLHLRKLNMSLDQIPAEIKQKIRENLQCYPELELEMERQSDSDG